MGDCNLRLVALPRHQMSMKIVFILALAVSAYALPSSEESFTEEVPPAVELLSTSEAEAIHQEAQEYLKIAGDNACKSLADATEQEVKDNVAAEQAILDKIEKGANCPNEGQQAVQAASNALDAAEDKSKKADAAYDKALATPVNFGTHAFNSLTKGDCNVFYNSDNYKNAEADVKAKKDAKTAAAGAVTQSKKDLEPAKAAAVIAVRDCRCKTYKNHQTALAAANAKVASTNTKAWTKAAHLKCVLEGKTTNSCTVPALPEVKATTLASGVTAGTCSSWEGIAQCQNANLGSQKNWQLTDVTKTNGNGNWWSGCFMKNEIPAGKEFRLDTTWHPHKTGKGGNVHAMWGLSSGAAIKDNNGSKDMDSCKASSKCHYYPNMEYSFYCHAVNSHPYAYELGASHHLTSCNCGNKAYTRIIVRPSGQVDYYMSSNYHGWTLCRTSNKKATKFPYVVDESIYGTYCSLDLPLMRINDKNQWVDDKP